MNHIYHLNKYNFRNIKFDTLNEECGIVGIFNSEEASNYCYLALHALQHRGQEACGIVSFENLSVYHLYKNFGIVAENFNRQTLDKLKGNIAIGHVRYSTTGGKSFANIQPFIFKSKYGLIAIAHNGNLTNAKELKDKLEDEGSIFNSTSDTEVFMHLLSKSKKHKLIDKILDMLTLVKGAYSLIISTPQVMYAIKDPYGFRPLVLGKKDNSYIVVSESCALDLIDANYIREIKPGEILEITQDETKSYEHPIKVENEGFCVFELIYFSRPDSIFKNTSIYEIRKTLGRYLALEENTNLKADIVIPVPDSGVPMAMGYAQQLNIPYELGLIRNHYVGRTFIEPIQSIRDFGVKLKLNPVKPILEGKDVVVIDDSIVRGTTSTKIVRILRKAGAKSVHMRIASPPIMYPCYFGVDTPKRSHLLAAQKTISEMCKFIEADSLKFLSIEGLAKAVGDINQNKCCYGCFHGNYAEPLPSTFSQS